MMTWSGFSQLFLLCQILLLSGTVYVLKASHLREKRLTEADICNLTKSTLEKIDGCPTSNNELQKRIQRKMCQNYVLCRDEELFYHCVKYLDRFAEVCSPKHSIRGNVCPLFDDGIGRIIEDFNTSCIDCPVLYNSTDYWMYWSCVKRPQKLISGSTSNLDIHKSKNTATTGTNNSSITSTKPCNKNNRTAHGKRIKCLNGEVTNLKPSYVAKPEEKRERRSRNTGNEKNEIVFYVYLVLIVSTLIMALIPSCIHLKKRIMKWLSKQKRVKSETTSNDVMS